MWKTDEVHFDGDYLFKSQALPTTTTGAITYSSAFKLGETEGGIRLHAYTDGAITWASGAEPILSIAFRFGNDTNCNDGEHLYNVAFDELGGTSYEGYLASMVPDALAEANQLDTALRSKMKYCKAAFSVSSGVATGNFNVAVELIP